MSHTYAKILSVRSFENVLRELDKEILLQSFWKVNLDLLKSMTFCIEFIKSRFDNYVS